jgi:GT2 family glycosyltransferase
MGTEPLTSPSRPAPGATATVTAVVVTHRRPRLAGDLVRTLVEIEHIAPERVIVVVNGDGGLDDAVLESSVRMLRLPGNLGPAAGFKAGIEQAFLDPGTKWAYLCEDDVGLMPLPLPRVAGLLERVEEHRLTDPNVGAVVAYGRILERRTGNAVNSVPAPGQPQDLSPVDVAAWGATLLSRRVASAGVLPDPDWFFGFEDFDYFLRIREAGFSVLVDSVAARAVEAHETTQGREHLHQGVRPSDSDESWRAYYTTRNFFSLARRHGSLTWIASHLAYSARRLQLSRGRRARLAIAHGLVDGALGKLGPNPRYLREVGELTNSLDTTPGLGA